MILRKGDLHTAIGDEWELSGEGVKNPDTVSVSIPTTAWCLPHQPRPHGAGI